MKYLPYIAVFLTVTAVLLLFFVWRKKKAAAALNPPLPPANSNSGNQNNDQPTLLDYNLLLKKGIYNSPEVEELQTRLGEIDVDGDFGPETENRLFAVKGVMEIRLKDYDSTTANTNIPWYYQLAYGYTLFGTSNE